MIYLVDWKNTSNYNTIIRLDGHDGRDTEKGGESNAHAIRYWMRTLASPGDLVCTVHCVHPNYIHCMPGVCDFVDLMKKRRRAQRRRCSEREENGNGVCVCVC